MLWILILPVGSMRFLTTCQFGAKRFTQRKTNCQLNDGSVFKKKLVGFCKNLGTVYMAGRIPLALTNNPPPLWINWINNPI